MNFIQRFKLGVYLLVLLSFFGLTYAERNPTLLFISLLALGLSWLLVEGRHGRTLSRLWINLGVLVSSLLLFYELAIQHQDSLLLALGHFMIYIILCKSFETKSNRDYAQILVLSLLVLVIASIFSSSVLFGAIFTLYMTLALYTVLLFHLRNEALAAQARGTPLPAAFVDRPLREDLRRVAWAAGGVMALFAAVVFLFFPRDRGRDMFGAWNINASNLITGFSDRVSLDTSSPITESQTVVMQVHMEQNGVAYGNAGMQPYFRAVTLDFYDIDGKQWVRIPPPYTPRPITEANDQYIYLVEPSSAERATFITQKYIVFNSGYMLFSLPEAALLKSRQFPRGSVQRLARENSLILLGQPPLEFRYEVQSYPDYHQRKLPGSSRLATVGHINANNRNEVTTQPAPMPPAIAAKAREIAAPVLAQSGSTLTAAQTREIAERMVQELGTYPYTLQNPGKVDPDLDPTADFLVNKKKIGGHCEYFASAMVLMCTALNIPARMATGYHGGTYNTVGDFYVVRQRHAHAWVEVYLDDLGWTIFDPTPPAPDVELDERSILVTWSEELFQTIEHQWLTSVIGFDDSSRRYMFEGGLAQLQALPLWIASQFGDIRAGFVDILTARKSSIVARVIYVCEVPALLGLSAWLGARLWRRRQSTVRKMLRKVDRTQRREMALELDFFDDFMRVLRRTGVRQSSWQTPREYVKSACAGRNDAAAEAEWVVQTFYELFFGGAKMTPPLLEKIDQSLNRLRQLLPKSRLTELYLKIFGL